MRYGIKKIDGQFYSCFRLPTSSFIFTSSRSTSRRKAAVAVLMAAELFFVFIVNSVRNSESAARNKYACCWEVELYWGASIIQSLAYVIQVFNGQTFLSHFTNTVYEECPSCAHETASRLLGKSLLQGCKEHMGMKWRAWVRRQSA
jgi:hypothetical protein